MKLKDKDKVKVKPCKTIVIEEEPPPAPQLLGSNNADVIVRLSLEEIGLVIGHLPSSTVQNWVQSVGAQPTAVQSSGAQSSEFCGSVSSRVFFLQTLKMKFVPPAAFVSLVRVSCIATSRCDPGQREGRDAAASPPL